MPEIRYRRPLRAFLAGMRRRLQSQRGFALIEVVVSAALLMVVAGGVFAGIDGPAKISGQSEARSQATVIAQQDQERMRAMPFDSLVGYTQTTPITVSGATYSRLSKAIWIKDANDTDSCTTPGDDTTGDYLKITSTVTPPGGGAPAKLDSLLAPPPGAASTKGTLAVQIKNQLDAPVVGESVTITGPVNMTVSTNDAGCAVFGLVEKGNYTVSFSTAGWVDPSGVTNVTRATSVTAGSTTIVNHSYAQSGRINVSVDTKVGAAAPVASPAKGVMVANGGIPAGTLSFAAPASPTQGSSTFALDVYPFPSGYGVWAGTCTAHNPTLYGVTGVVAAPGPGGTTNVTVRQPSIVVNGATGVPGVAPATYPITTTTVFVYTSIDSGCTEKRTFTSNSSGVHPYPGTPYGNWKLCGSQSGVYAQRNTFLNNIANGQTTTVAYVGNGSCP